MVVEALIGGRRVVVVASGDDRIGSGVHRDRVARREVGLEVGRVRWGGELEQDHLDAGTGVVADVGDVVAANKMEAGGISPVLVKIGGAHRPVGHISGLRQREPGWGRNDLCGQPAVTRRPIDRAAPLRRAGRRRGRRAGGARTGRTGGPRRGYWRGEDSGQDGGRGGTHHGGTDQQQTNEASHGRSSCHHGGRCAISAREGFRWHATTECPRRRTMLRGEGALALTPARPQHPPITAT